jgi:hypothetical protein
MHGWLAFLIFMIAYCEIGLPYKEEENLVKFLEVKLYLPIKQLQVSVLKQVSFKAVDYNKNPINELSTI